MTKAEQYKIKEAEAEQYKIKEAEIKILEICRENGIDAIQLSDISLKLSNIQKKEKKYLIKRIN